MSWSAVLDTVIGLSFAFLLIATFSAGIVEAISNLLRKRPKMLVRGLTELLATAAPTPVSSKADWLSSQFSSIGTQRAAYRDALSGGAAQHPSPPMAPQARTAPQGTPPGWPPPPGAPPADWSPPAGWTAPPSAHPPGWTPPGLAPPAPLTPPSPPAPSAPLGLLTAVLDHPLVEPLKTADPNGKKTRLPSYLPAQTVVAALLDTLLRRSGATDRETTAAAVETAIGTVGGELEKALQALWQRAENDVDRFRQSVEGWYDAQMDRVSGWYKRWTKRWVIVFALLITVLFRVDAITLAEHLYSDGTLRTTVAEVTAAQLEKDGGLCTAPGTDVLQCAREAVNGAAAQGFPIGWSGTDVDGFWSFLTLVLGLLLTAGAATLGAPFWYDQLNRLGSMRNTGRKPTSSS
jgi:hypothetical protein